MSARGEQPKPSNRFWQLLRGGDAWQVYEGDAVRLVGAIVGMAVDGGVPLWKLEAWLTDSTNAAAEHVRRPGNPDGRVSLRTIRQWYAKSEQQLQPPAWNREDHREQLEQLRQLASSSSWPAWIEAKAGKGGRLVKVRSVAVRKVLAAHLAAAIESRGIDYPASRRFLAYRAGVSDGAAERVTQVLVAAGVLRRSRPPGRVGPFTAANYRVMTNGDALRRMLAIQADDLADLAHLECHPVWRHGSGMRFDVWARIVMEDGRATVPTIAAATGASDGTVRRVARKLEDENLIERCLDGSLRAVTTDHRAALDAAALRVGTAEKARRQLERHADERAEHVRRVLRSPRLFAEAMRRNVAAVVEAIRTRVVANLETGEVLEQLPAPAVHDLIDSSHPNAPPERVA